MKHSSQAKYDPWEDQDCVSAFIEFNQDDFEQEMIERGIESDYWCDHEITYCENHQSKFLDFAYNYAESLVESAADHYNDEERSNES